MNVSAGQPKPATAQSPELPGAAAAVTVPDVAGMKLGKARKEIRKAGLVTEIRPVTSGLHKVQLCGNRTKTRSYRRRHATA